MSVTISGFEVKKNQKGEEFVVLNLMSEPVMEQSNNTGNFFINTYKTNVVASFDEATAKLMVGKQLPGNIIKKECDAYSYTVKATGKKVILTHTYEYVQSGSEVFNDSKVPSDGIDGDPFA